jgi:hypothetical protein
MRYREYLIECGNFFQSRTTKDQTGHIHDAFANSDGFGHTRAIYDGDDHVHKIVNWIVQSAHSHTHKLEEWTPQKDRSP